MWQRVQTLYMAISTVLALVMVLGVKAIIPSADGSEARVISYAAYIPYLILLVIILILDVLALTTWKFRVFQMRTAVLSAIITLALQIWLAVDFFSNMGACVYRISAVFPIVCVILDLLAARGILADEMLVRSTYHLRSSKRKR